MQKRTSYTIIFLFIHFTGPTQLKKILLESLIFFEKLLSTTLHLRLCRIHFKFDIEFNIIVVLQVDEMDSGIFVEGRWVFLQC